VNSPIGSDTAWNSNRTVARLVVGSADDGDCVTLSSTNHLHGCYCSTRQPIGQYPFDLNFVTYPVSYLVNRQTALAGPIPVRGEPRKRSP
jgi:hypothetical protein